MSDTPSDTTGVKPQPPVDTVIDLLGKRLVGDVDRGRLHKALERADAPQTGRAGADQAIGRAINGRTPGHR